MKLDRKKFGATLGAFVLAAVFASASQAPALDLNPQAIQKIDRLSRDRLWLRLLHLAAVGTEVLSPSFYLSAIPHRRIDPSAELKLNLEQALTRPDYRCEFPARDKWLRAHFTELSFATSSSPSLSSCQQLEKWRAALSVESISVVYPNHSLESSLSIFSHTFIKLNSSKLPADSNLNIALGFAAEFDPGDSFAKLAALGIFGGYIGKFGMSNYYAEVNRYGESESRDIFEYQLKLNPSEVNFLLDHVWEILDAQFHYYFLNGNCSYHLLALLEVARPDLELTSQFHFVTVPLSSLKLLIAQKNLVGEMRWVPGKQTRQAQMTESLSPAGLALYQQWRTRRRAGDLSEAIRSASLSMEEEVTVLDLLAESTRGEAESKELRHEVLNLRSHLPVGPLHQELPKERPQDSHGAHTVSVGMGYDQGGAGWAQLRYRFVLHSLLDPSEGYFRNTTLEVGDLRVRYNHEKQFENSSFTLLNALVLKPWSFDQHRLSWEARSEVLNFTKATRWQNRGGLGLTKKIGIANVYALGVVDSFVDGQEMGNLGIFGGASFGAYLSFCEKIKIKGALDHLWPLQSVRKENFWQGELQAGYSYSTNLSLQLKSVSSWDRQSMLLEALAYY